MVYNCIQMKNIFRFRDKWIYEQVKDYISARDEALDFGCGTGRAGAYIRQKTGCNIAGVDVVKYPIQAIKTVIYNGKTIPFQDKFFTVALVSFVLHHIPHNQQKETLLELKRVTNGKIIILEDLFEDGLKKWWLYLIEYLLNRIYFIKVPVPFAFRTPEEWQKLFEAAGLIVANQKTVRSPTPFLKHLVYALSPAKDSKK